MQKLVQRVRNFKKRNQSWYQAATTPICEQLGFGDVKANHKDFYQYINRQKKDRVSLLWKIEMEASGVAKSESEKAAEFNGQLTDVFTKSEYSQVPLWIDQPLSWKILLLLKKELQNSWKVRTPLKP